MAVRDIEIHNKIHPLCTKKNTKIPRLYTKNCGKALSTSVFKKLLRLVLWLDGSLAETRLSNWSANWAFGFGGWWNGGGSDGGGSGRTLWLVGCDGGGLSSCWGCWGYRRILRLPAKHTLEGVSSNIQKGGLRLNRGFNGRRWWRIVDGGNDWDWW